MNLRVCRHRNAAWACGLCAERRAWLVLVVSCLIAAGALVIGVRVMGG